MVSYCIVVAALLSIIVPTNMALTCPWAQFRLHGMESCQPWLHCEQMIELPIGDLLGFGAVKKLYKSEWEGYPVAIAFLNNPAYREDFHTGLNNLKALSVYTGKVVQLIGFCDTSDVYVTELHSFKDASNFNSFLQTFHFSDIVEEMKIRLRFCMKYIEILVTLHKFPLGPMVLCDSNTLEKTLEQYLLSEEHLLLLGDTDALPIVLEKPSRQGATWNHDVSFIEPCSCDYLRDGVTVSSNPASSSHASNYFIRYGCWSVCYCQPTGSSQAISTLPMPDLGFSGIALEKDEYSAVLKAMPRGEGGIRCGTKALTGEFIAPEQRSDEAVFPSRQESDVSGEEHGCSGGLCLQRTNDLFAHDFKLQQLVYDEATDVFKIPPVCEFFLGDGTAADRIKSKLSGIHAQCKSPLAGNRPNAAQVLIAYKSVYGHLNAILVDV